MAKLKDISFVMPVLNEEHHLEVAVESVLSQKTPGKSELILALGPSTDNTNAIAQRLAKSSRRIKLVENLTGNTGAGLNTAIAASSFEVIVRVDAHSELTEEYAATALKILNETGAANVGGRMVAKGQSHFQSAVAFGYNNRIGLGGGSFHVGGTAGPADTVYLGVFRKAALDKVGGFDPKWVRGQDWELNLRLRKAGETVWFDPRLAVGYYPRRDLPSLAKQFFRTGLWRGSLTRDNPGDSKFRYWIPPLLVLGSIFWFPAWLYLMAIGFYVVGQTALPWPVRLWLWLVLPTMHYSWGTGFWFGLVRGQTGPS